MADITASMVKDLREKTGAGMMDAKKALVENGGDIEKSVDWLRAKGLAKAAKKSGRTAAEGLVAVETNGTTGAVVEVNSETDFVARNAEFQDFVKKTASIALSANSVEDLASKGFGGGKSVQETLTDLIAKIGENMTLRRMQRLQVGKGLVAAYVHGALGEGLGKIGVLVALESEAKKETLEALGKQIAMHIAAANPESLDVAGLDPALLERERSVLIEQARESGKPDNIIEKMIEGRVRKYYEEVVLLEQVFVIDGETKVSQVVEKAAKDAGSSIKITGFARVQLGGGIEKEEEDFAAEVAKVANG
ncbi:MAG: translation elongation factor Ts [Alphaproteobacteria bacterium]|nr:translation elongation factor Ts [Alphaproteobacteria bacterium]